MTASVEVVVAKYKENISWLGHIRHRVTVYDKSDNPVNGSHRLQNIGRESHTYLYHIVSRYNTLSDITIFVQGRAYDHCDAVGNSEGELIRYINNIVTINTPFQPLCQPLKIPTWAAADVKTWYDRARSKKIFLDPVVEDTPFAFGAQYIVRKDAILSKSLAFWISLYEMSKTSVYGDDREDKIDPWTLEMMWTCIFNPEQHEKPIKNQALCLITSVIKTPPLPLSYTNTRSVFTPEERYNQTINTIESVRNKIPGVIICLVECSDIDPQHLLEITSRVDYFLNIFDNAELRTRVYSPSKSMGEGTMTIAALNYIREQSIQYTSFYKLSGRYSLADSFIPEEHPLVVKPISGNIHNVSTLFFKLNKESVQDFYTFLVSHESDMKNCKGYEVLFAEFISSRDLVKFTDTLGVSGYVSVDADKTLHTW